MAASSSCTTNLGRWGSNRGFDDVNMKLRENKHWHTPPEALYISARVWYTEWGNIWRLLRLRTCTCGMMVSLERRSCSPISAIFTLSTVISPAAASSSLKRHSVMDDLPAPVRPTIPIWAGKYRLIGGVGHFWRARRPPGGRAPPSLLLGRSARAAWGRGPVPPGSERCSRGTPRCHAWAIQAAASCPPPPRGPVSRKRCVRETFTEQLVSGTRFVFFSRTDLSITRTGFKESKDHAVRSHSEQPNIYFTLGTHWEVQNKGFRHNGSNSARRTPCCNSCDKAWACTACTAAETPWLAGSRPTLLDLIRVYRQLGGRMFYGMWVILVLGVF